MEIKTKFNIDQEIYYMENNKVETADITEMFIEVKNNHYYKTEYTVKYKVKTD